MLTRLAHKQVAVLGFGLEGKTVIGYLARHGIKPVLFDERGFSEFRPAEQKFIQRYCAKAVLGKTAFQKLDKVEVAFKSPGIPPRKLKSLSKTAELTSQTAEFLTQFSHQTIGVTGTKGKGTTSTLIYEMLKASGKSAYLTGNIGKEQAFEIADRLKPQDWIVFELSSFQLREVSASPHIAVVLMTTSEHLNWHANQKDYWLSKAGITRYQTDADWTLYNPDYPGSRFVGKFGKGKKTCASRFQAVKPGCYVSGGQIVRRFNGKLTTVLPLRQLALKGEHNWENACAAAEAAFLAGCKISAVRQVLKNFKGLEHRLEFAGKKQGIVFYNDSFSTIPETSLAAVRAFKEPLVAILGGSGKKSDFSELARGLKQQKNLRALVLIGSEAGRILSALRLAGFPGDKILAGGSNFKNAFLTAKGAAQKGDVVLLSPACASFDMFKNYKQRGEAFKRLVKNLHD